MMRQDSESGPISNQLYWWPRFQGSTYHRSHGRVKDDLGIYYPEKIIHDSAKNGNNGPLTNAGSSPPQCNASRAWNTLSNEVTAIWKFVGCNHRIKNQLTNLHPRFLPAKVWIAWGFIEVIAYSKLRSLSVSNVILWLVVWTTAEGNVHQCSVSSARITNLHRSRQSWVSRRPDWVKSCWEESHELVHTYEKKHAEWEIYRKNMSRSEAKNAWGVTSPAE